MKNIELTVEDFLFKNQDVEYKKFQQKLINNIDPKRIVGVRTPALRSFAKDFSKTADAKIFLKILPHKYFEENQIHGFIIEKIKDFDDAILQVENYLPYIDNWATCDQMKPKSFKKNIPSLYKKCKEWCASKKTYTVRFGIGMLMSFFLDEKFSVEQAKLISKIQSDEYYVNMMIAWYFATALAKQYDTAITFIEKNKLSVWVHNKTIQKAVESFRVTDGHKAYLKSLKRI